jgi:hypothetical protein
VTQVTQWYLNRIARYDGVYHAVIHVDATGALATAAAEDDAKKKSGKAFKPTALWGIPMVVKANTSVKGLVTSNGWAGYTTPVTSSLRQRTRPSSQSSKRRRGNPRPNEHARLREFRHNNQLRGRPHGKCLQLAIQSGRISGER